MIFCRYLLLAGLVFLVGKAAAEDGLSAESQAWNAGVEAYLAGDATNALERLEPLMKTKSHGARAAEIVARLEQDAAKQAEGADRLAHLEAAVRAAQIALRAKPDDRLANDNFTRAVADVPELREKLRREALIASAKGGPEADRRVRRGLTESRAIWSEARRLAEQPAARRIELADGLEARANRLADDCLVLCETETNQVSQLEAARDRVLYAAQQLGDLGPGAVDSAGLVEDAFVDLILDRLEVPALLTEGEAAQTNAWADVDSIGAVGWQEDALACTQRFQQTFPAWAQPYEQVPPGSTNEPPLTAEAKGRILELTDQLVTEQEACCQNPEKARQEKALALIREIRDLLPHDPQQDDQQQEDQQKKDDQQQDQQQNQDQNQQQNSQSKQDRQQQQDQSSANQDQEQPPDASQDKDDQQKDDEQKDDGEKQDEDRQEQPDQPQQAEPQQAQEAAPLEPSEDEEKERRAAELLQRVLDESAGYWRKQEQEKPRQRTVDRDW